MNMTPDTDAVESFDHIHRNSRKLKRMEI